LNELLKNLALDRWYKVLIVASFALLVLSLTTPVLVIPNAALALMSLGGFLFGIGEWINHPKRVQVQTGYGGLMKWTSFARIWHPGGIALDIGGAASFIWGAYIAVATLS